MRGYREQHGTGIMNIVNTPLGIGKGHNQGPGSKQNRVPPVVILSVEKGVWGPER